MRRWIVGRAMVRAWIVILPSAVSCGDDGGGDPVDGGSGSASEGTAASDPTEGATTSQGESTDGIGTACALAEDEATCEATDPGGGHGCAWVPYYVVTTDGEGVDLSCTWGEPEYLCVQELGSSEGGTPFGSCGGDGSVPVYYREQDGVVELVATDGFFMPDGWSPCDCHGEDAPEDGDPVACCCSCTWSPGA